MEDETNNDENFYEPGVAGCYDTSGTYPFFIGSSHANHSVSWDGNTRIIEYHSDPTLPLIDQKINDLMKRIEVIERTLLRVLDTLNRMKGK